MKNAITFNFLNINDKEATQDVLKNIHYKTYESHPVILNKALRRYYNDILIGKI